MTAECSYPEDNDSIIVERRKDSLIRTCPTCGHHVKYQDQVQYSTFIIFFFSLVKLMILGCLFIISCRGGFTHKIETICPPFDVLFPVPPINYVLSFRNQLCKVITVVSILFYWWDQKEDTKRGQKVLTLNPNKYEVLMYVVLIY